MHTQYIGYPLSLFVIDCCFEELKGNPCDTSCTYPNPTINRLTQHQNGNRYSSIEGNLFLNFITVYKNIIKSAKIIMVNPKFCWFVCLYTHIY